MAAYGGVRYQITRQSFTVGSSGGTYASERLNLGAPGYDSHAGILGVTCMLEALVATATAELWLLKANGTIGTDADYFFSGLSTTVGATWPLASWPAAQIRVKSGGTSGTCTVNASAD